MISPPDGLLSSPIADVPVAVLDFETTGMWAGVDRVVEVAVVRVEPGRGPELVLDTLVHPGRRVACTYVHGITDRDVVDAPRFEHVAGRLLQALRGCVVAAYNVAFDLRFLEAELALAGVRHEFPHLCLMYLRPMLGLGKHCRLSAACRAAWHPARSGPRGGPGRPRRRPAVDNLPRRDRRPQHPDLRRPGRRQEVQVHRQLRPGSASGWVRRPDGGPRRACAARGHLAPV